jgi:phage gpG-like protein
VSIEIKNTKNLDKFINKIAKEKNKTLLVGFLNSTQAKIASKNEFGGIYSVDDEYRNKALAKGVHLGATISIPPRPFMGLTFNDKKDEWAKKLTQLMKKTLNADQSLQMLGEIVKSDIQKVAIKEKYSVLRDTGEMRNSIEYKVIGK